VIIRLLTPAGVAVKLGNKHKALRTAGVDGVKNSAEGGKYAVSGGLSSNNYLHLLTKLKITLNSPRYLICDTHSNNEAECTEEDRSLQLTGSL
jgi:hypothetical protein